MTANCSGTTNIEQAMSLACQHHLAQHFAEAEDLYRAVLAQEPNHTIAHHNLGVMLVQAGDPEVYKKFAHLKGCGRWFGMSITAEGTVSHCCMDAHATWPWGNVASSHVLDIYNTPRLRALRQSLPPRSGSGTPCDRCDIL